MKMRSWGIVYHERLDFATHVGVFALAVVMIGLAKYGKYDCGFVICFIWR